MQLKVWTIGILVLIAGVMLLGCAGAATTAPTAAPPTAAPSGATAAPSEPTAAPSEPTAAPAQATAAPAAGNFSFAIVFPGPRGDRSFIDASARGAERAISELGVKGNLIE